jgi:quinol monooxygenase YgiN
VERVSVAIQRGYVAATLLPIAIWPSDPGCRKQSRHCEAVSKDEAMLVITGTFRIPPANVDAARPVMAAMIAASRAEEGCLAYAYGEDVLDSGLIRVVEHWTTRETLAAHAASEHIRKWRAAWSALGIGERDLMLFESGTGTKI